MAEKKKKSIYSRKLKDVNKDGKRNFGDTWLGDLLGADGKAGVQKDSMKDSLKGSRRESDKVSKSKSTTKTTAKKKSIVSSVDKTDDARASRKMSSSGKTSTRSKVDTTDDKRSARTNTSSGPKPKLKGVTYDEYLSIDNNNALKGLMYGLPSGMSEREFITAARKDRSAKAKNARLDRTDDARARGKRTNPGGPNIPGKAKGGMAKKTGYSKGGMTAANCGASMKPNRKAKK